MKVAVTGKGGVGKTTLSSTLARLYADEGRTVLAADVDPDANLGLALGLTQEKAAEKIDRALSELSGLLADPAIKSTIARINEAAANLETTTAAVARTLDEKRIAHFLEMLDAAR